MGGCNQSVAFRKMCKVVKLWSKNAETDASLQKELTKSTKEISHVFKDINEEIDTKRLKRAD